MRVGATDGEATKPSEMRLSRSDQVWVSEANCEAAARPRASAERHKDTEGYLEFYVIYVFFVAENTENLIKTIHFV